MARHKGRVKRFNNAKGLGFMGLEDGPEVFVDFSSIQLQGYKTLKESDEMEFDNVEGSKGPQADKGTYFKDTVHGGSLAERMPKRIRQWCSKTDFELRLCGRCPGIKDYLFPARKGITAPARRPQVASTW